VFDTSRWYDFISAISISAILSFLGSLIVPRFWLFAILLTPVAGVIIAEVVRFAVQKRRSLRLFRIAAIAAAVGSLPYLVMSVFFLFQGGFGSILDVILRFIYTSIVTSTVYYRLSGIELGR
jgi:hypothetical protein